MDIFIEHFRLFHSTHHHSILLRPSFSTASKMTEQRASKKIEDGKYLERVFQTNGQTKTILLALTHLPGRAMLAVRLLTSFIWEIDLLPRKKQKQT